MNRRGASGEGIVTLYRVILISLIALGILGISSVSYVHYIDVREVEAHLMYVGVLKCLAGSEGIVNLDFFGSEEKKENLLKSCGYGGEMSRFFVRATIYDSSLNKVIEIYQGDVGNLWLKNFFEKVKMSSGDAVKRNPGYYKNSVPLDVKYLKDGKIENGKIDLEVFVNAE